MVAGVEQVAWSLVETPDPILISLSLAHLGEVVPRSVEVAVSDLAAYIGSETFRQDALEIGHKAVEGVLHHVPTAIALPSARTLAGFAGSALHQSAPQITDMLIHALSQPLHHLQDAAHALHVADVAVTGGLYGHFPFGTAALSLYREGRLVMAGDADVVGAGTRVGLDVTASWLGAKLGAALGTMILPGAGTVVGGIAGGVAGRLGRDWWTREAYRDAVAQYETRRRELDAESDRINAELDQRVRALVTAERLRFLAIAGPRPTIDEAANRRLGRGATELRDAIADEAAAARTTLAEARRLRVNGALGPDIERIDVSLNVIDVAVHDFDAGGIRDCALAGVLALSALAVPANSAVEGRYEAALGALQRELDSLSAWFTATVDAWTQHAFVAFEASRESLVGEVDQELQRHVGLRRRHLRER